MFRVIKNLAKQRALDFGRTDITHAVETSQGSILDESMADSSTFVVRSTATEDEVYGVDSSQNDDLQMKPRGFFADQFEVRRMKSRSQRHSLKNLQFCRTGVTLRRITTALVLKFGDRRTARSRLSCLALVNSCILHHLQRKTKN